MSCRSSDGDDEEMLEMLATMKTLLEDSCKYTLSEAKTSLIANGLDL